KVTMPAGWEAVAEQLSRSTDATVRELAQSLSVTFGSEQAFEALRRQVADGSASPEGRRAALNTLLEARDPRLAALLPGLIRDPALRSPALRAMAAYEDPAIPRAILAVYPELSGPEKRDALNTLTARVAFARQLLDAVNTEHVPVRDLTAELVRQLRRFEDPEINARVSELWGIARTSGADKLEQIQNYKRMLSAEAESDPDLNRGRAVFARVCQQCHLLYDVGGRVGPDLTGSNRRDLDYLLENMVDPNAVIPNDYLTTTIETTDDRFLSGVVLRQDERSVTLALVNDTLTIPRGEIASMEQSDISMMPEGLLDVLKADEVRDLVAYLRGSGQVPMRPDPDQVDLLFNGVDLTGWEGDYDLWTVENGEIVGRSEGLTTNAFLRGPLLLGDFRLVLEVKLVPDTGNSGVQFRSEPWEEGSVKGYQADIGAGWWGKLYEEHGRGLLRDQPGDAHVRKGDWNTYEIVAVGPRLLTAINGNVCVDWEDEAGAREGILAFQLHSGRPMEVRFRNLRVELEPEARLSTVQ
ncbi:MAG TPA: family 16 glycoside hydrolase, partial [Methylomirabilota bacterium]|nr:family 16 glycoside hydrolase [Methylomirabilota bacterium]